MTSPERAHRPPRICPARPALGVAQLLDAMLTGFEAVAIDDFDAITLQPRGSLAAHVRDQRGKLTAPWAVSEPLGWWVIASKSSMATASKPVSIASRSCATPRVGPCRANRLVVYEPAQGLVTDVFPCENGHAQERSLFGPLAPDGGGRVICGLKTANFVRETFCVTSTIGGPSSSPVNIGGSSLRFWKRYASVAAQRPAAWLNNGSKWWMSKARGMSFGACASS